MFYTLLPIDAELSGKHALVCLLVNISKTVVEVYQQKKMPEG